MNKYKILGVDENSSIDEIKKKFRCLQLKLHPDKDNSYENKRKYIEICSAYETLSDEELRKQYDLSLNKSSLTVVNDVEKTKTNVLGNVLDTILLGSKKDKEKEEEMPDILNNIMGNMMGNMIGKMKNMDMKLDAHIGFIVEPIIKSVTVSFLDAYRGTVLPVCIEREVSYVTSEKMNNMKEKETIYIKIPEGIDENEVITLEGRGNIYGKERGDIKIVINLERNEEYAREGIDLIYKKKISLKEALCGFEFSLEHLNQKIYKISNNNRIIESGYEQRIQGLGFKREETNIVGDLVICFKVIFPKNLSQDRLEELKKIL